jgi:ADP-ribose pyrophosphatase YjhB (NUDIX family)
MATLPRRAEQTARAIITLGDRVLVCQGKTEDYCHLPGGHVEAGEHPADALKRELKEEAGREVSYLKHLADIDNIFDKGNTRVEESMSLYKADLYPMLVEHPARSLEDHLDVKWIPIAEMAAENLLPPAVRPYVEMVGGA